VEIIEAVLQNNCQCVGSFSLSVKLS